MLRDITIGQHFPGNSLVHRFDPRLKLVLTILYIVLLFAASNPLGLALSLVFLAVMYAVAKIPFRLIVKSLKPIFPIIVFTAVLNLFLVSIISSIKSRIFGVTSSTFLHSFSKMVSPCTLICLNAMSFLLLFSFNLLLYCLRITLLYNNSINSYQTGYKSFQILY